MREPTTQTIKIGNMYHKFEFISEVGNNIDPLEWHQNTLEMDATYRRLFNPVWEHIATHETLTIEDTIFLSQGVDPLSAKKLAKIADDALSGSDEEKKAFYAKYQKELEPAGFGLLDWLSHIKHNGETRDEEINANYHLFQAHGGRINRQKYYEWMKKNNKLIPDKFALAPIQKPEPEVTKGNTQSFDEWMIWRIENQGLNIKDLMPYGFKTTLVNETKKKPFNYKDDSAVKQSWIRLGISSNKDRNTRITQNT